MRPTTAIRVPRGGRDASGLVRRLVATRRRFLDLLFESAPGGAAALRLLEERQAGDEAFDRILRGEEPADVPTPGLLRQLPVAIHRLRRLLFAAYEGTSNVARLRRVWARLLERQRMTPAEARRAFESLRKLSRRLEAEMPEARRDLERELLEPADRFRARVRLLERLAREDEDLRARLAERHAAPGRAAREALARAIDSYDPASGDFDRFVAGLLAAELRRAREDRERTKSLPLRVCGDAAGMTALSRRLAGVLRRAPTLDDLAGASFDFPGGEAVVLRVVWSRKRRNRFATGPLSASPDRAGRLGRYLRSLPHREGEILSLRFGAVHGAPRTPREVAALLGISEARARELEAGALRRLKIAARRLSLERLVPEASE